MRESWNLSPTCDPEAKDEREYTEEEWLNLKSFAARLYGGLGAGIFRFFCRLPNIRWLRRGAGN
ncbi:hypothetical protein F4776DRAFT_128732 [Hypoxylon sp. NC0597]|nr:hypothetical protein F4776DRAFT_128732 [Hypoxylon sp. NC0597]